MAALVVLTSCNEELDERNSSQVNFSAEITSAPQTKTSFDYANAGSQINTAWSSDDCIGIFSSESDNNLPYEAGGNGVKVNFTPQQSGATYDDGCSYWAYYPYDQKNALISGVDCSVAPVQYYSNGDNQSKSFMYASACQVTSANVVLTFRNLHAVVTLGLKGSGTINAISLEAADPTKAVIMAGNYTCDLSQSTPVATFDQNGALSDKVVVRFDGGLTLSSNEVKVPIGVVPFTVPEGGLKLTVAAVGGGILEKTIWSTHSGVEIQSNTHVYQAVSSIDAATLEIPAGYHRVNEVSDDMSGKYLVAGSTDGQIVLNPATLSSSKFAPYSLIGSYKPLSDYFEITSDAQAIELNITKVADGYTIANASGEYIAYGSSTNFLALNTALPATNTNRAYWTIAEDGTSNLFKIGNVNATTRAILYRDTRVFGPYAASNADGTEYCYVALYKRTGSVEATRLATPTNLALVGEATTDSFTVEWDAVTGCTGYKVSTDAGATWSETQADTRFLKNGCTPATTYIVKVMAVGDGTLYTDSDPSEALTVTTKSGQTQTEQLIYSTGFESSEGFTTSNEYNNTSVKYQGPNAQQWGFVMGTTSTNAAIVGSQSAQMRSYSSSATHGAVYMNFGLANVTKVMYTASYSSSGSLNLYYSTDNGSSWSAATAQPLTTSKTDYTYTIDASGSYANVRIKFENAVVLKSCKVFIDNVRIYGIGSGGQTPTQLNAPTGLAVSGAPTAGSFTVGWNAVTGCSGYKVSTDAGATWSNTQSATSYTKNDCSPATTYSVTVKAIGNGTTNSDSQACSTLSVTTQASVAKEYMTVAEVRAFGEGATISVDKYLKATVISDRLTVNTGNVRTMFISDTSGGICVFFASGVTHTFDRGDEIEIALKGTGLSKYNGSLQFNSLALGNVTATGNVNAVTPIPITVTQLLTGNYQSQYVEVTGVGAASPSRSTSWAGSANTNHTFEDVAGNQFLVRVNSAATFRNASVPVGKGSLCGIASIFNSDIQILPQGASDYASLADFRVSASGTSVGAAGGAKTANVNANVAWNASIVSNPSNMLSITSTSTTAVQFLIAPNETSSSRSATVNITTTDSAIPTDMRTVSITYAQSGQGSSTTSTAAFGITDWMELPANVDNADYQYVRHSASNMRNYSMCFDQTKKAALWIAYPLHSCYLGSSGRTNAWQYDAAIEQSYQPYLGGGYGGSYDRGHQVPSGDRTISSEINSQTFYFTNMTPQLSSFNQKIWENLESTIRGNNFICADTLYIVTGAHFENTATTTTDKAGVSCPVPTHYYKVVARSVAGSNDGKQLSELSASQLQCVGFWFTHEPNTNNVSAVNMKSVAEIEQLTGFTFFANIPNLDKTSYTASAWGM